MRTNQFSIYSALFVVVSVLASCTTTMAADDTGAAQVSLPQVSTPTSLEPTKNTDREITLENGEILTFPEEAFETRVVAGVDIKEIEVVNNEQGEIEYFHLIHTGIDGTKYYYWTSPVEIQTNPEVIENYTPVNLIDMWSGRILFSEILSIDPIEDQGAAPAGFYYLDWIDGPDILIGLASGTPLGPAEVGGGCLDDRGEPIERWASFYLSTTPGGEELIIATRQILYADGRSSLFFHYAFGHEWPWDREYVDSYDLSKYNIIDSLFLNHEPGDHVKFRDPAPTIYFSANNADVDNFFYVLHGADAYGSTGAKELYDLDQNNLLYISDFTNLLQNRPFNECITKQAGEEIADLQTVFLLTASARWTPLSELDD